MSNWTIRIISGGDPVKTVQLTPPRGLQGLKGDKGDTGDIGPNGPPGPADPNSAFNIAKAGLNPGVTGNTGRGDPVWGLSDEDGYSSLWGEADASVFINELLVDSHSPAAEATEDWHLGFTDEDGYLGFGATPEGHFAYGMTQVEEVDLPGVMWAQVDEDYYAREIVYADGTKWSAEDTAPEAPVIAHLADRVHQMQYGQSLSVGLLGENALTTAQPYGNQMLNPGVRNTGIEGGSYTGFVPLIETNSAAGNYGETGVAAAANLFVEKLQAHGWPAPADQGFVVLGSSGGRGGASLAQLSKGATYYNGMLAMVQAGATLSAAAGETYMAGVINFVHGEADQEAGTTRADYATRGAKLINDMRADMAAIDKWGWRPPFLISQPSSHLHYNSTTPATAPVRPEIALAQRDIAAAVPDTYVCNAKYIFDYADDVHLINTSYQMQGKYFGRANEKIIRARLLGEPAPVIAVDLISAVWQGNLLDLQFSLPYGKLVFDTTWVAAAENMGFDIWSPDGLTLLNIIASVTIRGPDRVRLAFNQAPAKNARCTYGFGRAPNSKSGRLLGPRGNVHDTEGDIDFYVDLNNLTRRLDNWPIHFETIKP